MNNQLGNYLIILSVVLGVMKAFVGADSLVLLYLCYSQNKMNIRSLDLMRPLQTLFLQTS